MSDFQKGVLNELGTWPHSLRFWWLLVLAPGLGGVLLANLFGSGFIRELPVIICDLDGSSLSRSLLRRIDALPSVHVSHRTTSPDEGNASLRRGNGYALLLIPRHFERDMLRLRSPKIIAYVDGQHMPVGSILRNEITEMGAAFWSMEYGNLQARFGMSPEQARQTAALALDLRPIGNPALNYGVFLPHALIPAILQITLGVYFVCTLHRLRAEGRSTPSAICGTLLPGMLWAWFLCCATAAMLFWRGSLVLHGSFPTLCGLYLLFIAACAAMSLFLASLGDKLLQSLIIASAMTSPAFAFSGVAFPLAAMPAFGRFWASLLPLTHLMKLEGSIAQMGAPLMSQRTVLISLVFLLLAFGGGGLFLESLRRRTRNINRGGRT